jgi:hypothetical protein
MADINKFTTKEVLNKVLLDSSGNSVAAFSHTTQEALNAVLDSTNSRLNVSLVGGTISGDVTISGDLTVEGDGVLTISETIQGKLKVVEGAGSLPSGIDTTTGDLIIAQNNNDTSDIAAIYAIAGTAGSSHFVFGDANSKNPGRVSYDHSDDSMDLVTNSTVRMIIDSSGKISVGSSVPTEQFHIFQGADNQGLKITGYDDRNDKHAELYITSGGDLDITGSGHISINGGGNIYLYDYVLVQDRVTKTGAGTLQFGGTYDVDLHFLGTSDAVVMAIDHGNKRVGIGESSPDSTLHISSSTASDPIIKLENTGDNALAGQLIFLTSGAANNNDDSGVIRFKGMNDAGTPEEIEYATIYVNHDDISDGTEDATMFFRTQGSGSLANRLVLDGNSRISLSNNDSGTDNTIFGFNAGSSFTNNEKNVVIGDDAFKTASDGENNNVVIGASAGDSINSSGCDNNVIIGMEAGKTGTGSMSHNVVIGRDAMKSIGSSSQTGTVAIGSSALTTLTSGEKNTAVGYQALMNEDDGDFNTAVGYQALSNQEGRTGTVNNTAVGHRAGASMTNGIEDTLIGSNAGANITTGFANTAIGANTMDNMSTGDYNTAVGVQALSQEDVGRGTTAIGYHALYNQNSDSNDENTGNSALGYHAGYNMTTGTNNTLLGYEAGLAMTTGEGNVAIGYQALKKANHADADYNIGIGVGVGSEILNGYYNVLIGYNTGNTLTSGGENTIIGHNCDVASGDNNNNIIIGNNLTASDNDNRVYIGNDSSYIHNDFNSNATWTHSSDERQKKEIKDDTLGLDFINDIRPVTYKHKSPSEFPKEWTSYNADDKEPMGGDKVIHGLIAQEVKQALDKQGVDTFSGWDEGDDGRQSVSFEAFVLPLIKAVQELSARVKELESK